MVFCRFSLDELKETKEVLPLEVDENDIEFQVAFRYVRPGRDMQALERLTSLVKRNIPTVDMSVFKFSERKEIGPNSGSASGDPIFTKEEFDQILGPVSPGLKVGDELRFSGRLQNHSSNLLTDIKIESLCVEKVTNTSKLSPGDKITFLDLRYRVRSEDLETGKVSLAFKWSATHPNLGSTSGQISHQISTKSGLSMQ
jgi:hypothetical protein